MIELFLLLLGCCLKKLLYTEKCLAVPAEILIFRFLHKFKDCMDIILLIIDDPLLKIRVSDIRV